MSDAERGPSAGQPRGIERDSTEVDLADPALESVETWRAHLWFGPRDVWKVWKTPEARRSGDAHAAGPSSCDALALRHAACELHLQLNRELAPDVYRGLSAVMRTADGRRVVRSEAEAAGGTDRTRSAAGGSGARSRSEERIVDWAVHMARLPERERADRRLAEDRFGDTEVRAVARAIARFHARAEVVPSSRDAAAVALREMIRSAADGGQRDANCAEPAARAGALQLAFFDAHASLFEARAREGRVREGHGDLGLEHVFIDDDGVVRLIDRVAWDPRLRRADVGSDVALLAAELAAAGRSDLSERLLAAYAEEANDFDLYPLADFHESVRASARGSLELLRAAEGEKRARRAGSRKSVARRRAKARRWFLLAVTSLASRRRPLLPPVVVAMCGQVASGKSTVASALSAAIGAPIVSSDRTRDHLLGAQIGAEPHEIHWERAYDPGFIERTYDEVARRAGAVLASGRPVVVDGCFRFAEQRACVRAMAESAGHPFFFVEVRVPEDVQRERLHERAQRDGEPDSTWLDIAATLRSDWQPVTEIDPEQRIVLDTSEPLEASFAKLRARLPTWPEGLTG